MKITIHLFSGVVLGAPKDVAAADPLAAELMDLHHLAIGDQA